MNHMKHCELLRQPCHEPMRCGNVCQVVKREASDLPIVMFDKPYQWFTDLVCTAVYAVGVVSWVVLIGLGLGFIFARWIS